MSEQLEREIVSSIQKLAFCDIQFENNQCISLKFTNEADIFYGTIRHSKEKKQIFNLINQLPNLRTLDLRKCRVESLPKLDLPYLTHLDLGSNYLGSIPDWLKELKLSYLNLGVNGISHIPDWFADQEFETLKLHKNKIGYVPPLKPSLKNLNLYMNTMDDIPSFVWSLINLEFFSWGCSKIRTLDPAIGKLQNLLWLSFVPNKIENIPDTFCTLKKLKGVRFSKNCLNVLPDRIGDLQSLAEITLYDNQLTTLPESFFQLKLSKLNIGKNPLDDNIFKRVQTTFSHLSSISEHNLLASF